ncbi:MAG: hypothetical protein KAI33_07235, partial [Elusimicrobiales bacterium]|nr:hypothetical protein [Elusimicrobiales bacterium]
MSLGSQYEYERAVVVADGGIVFRCVSLESGLDTRFSLIWDKNEKEYVSFYNRQLSDDEINGLQEYHQIHNEQLSSDAVLWMGGKRQIYFEEDCKNARAHIFAIANPSEKKAFIAGARARKKTGGYSVKRPSMAYEIKEGTDPLQFRRGNLLGTFKSWREEKGLDRGGNCIITKKYLNSHGELRLIRNERWFVVEKLAGAQVETMVISGKVRFVRFIKDRKGRLIEDMLGNHPVIDIRQGFISNQIKIKLKLFQEEKAFEVKKKYESTASLFIDGKCAEASDIFSAIIFMKKSRVIPVFEEVLIAEKAKYHISFYRMHRKAISTIRSKRQIARKGGEHLLRLFKDAVYVFGFGDYA